MAAKRLFGVSTHVFRAQRLQRDHLFQIAAHGFETVEVVAGSGHFDAGNPAAVADLQQWLAEARLDLHAVAVPLGVDGKTAVDLAEEALHVARRIPVGVLVVAVGAPRDASKAVERLVEIAAPLGVITAVDSRSASMQPIGSLVHFVEQAEGRVGVALDCAVAAKGGGLVDAMEMASEHLAAVRVPVESAIDWSTAMTTMQKVGYDGPFIVDVGTGGSATRGIGVPGVNTHALASARKAREKMERWLTSI